MACRICTANDEEALVDAIAEAVWALTPEDGRSWANAGDYWQQTLREQARAMVKVARAGRPDHNEQRERHAGRAI